jgi:hypothetical protein
MSSRAFLAALLALGIGSLPVPAQTPKIQDEVNTRLAEQRARRADQAQRERYEEIEIMARLLDRGVDQLAGVGFRDGTQALAYFLDGSMPAGSSGAGGSDRVRVWDVHTGKRIAAHAGLDLTGVQGVYLKGQGAVFTTTVPLHFQRPVGGADRATPKPLTEWERVRRELRGEPVEAPKGHDATDTSIADAVLKVLAENGKNLTHIPEEESVTVALTLAPGPACASCHNAGGAGTMGPGGMGSGMMPSGGGPMGGAGGMGPPGMGSGMGPRGPGDPRMGGPPGMLGSGGGPTGPGSGGGPPGPGAGSGPATGGGGPPDAASALADFRKFALMGDLALKQNDYLQAVEQYRKAAAVRIPHVDAAVVLEHAEVTTKLARALMAQGKLAEADKVVAGLQELAQSLKERRGPDKPAEKRPEMTLPAKLIITVPKKLLDLAGAGKAPFDEFRKAASVEYLAFDK